LDHITVSDDLLTEATKTVDGRLNQLSAFLSEQQGVDIEIVDEAIQTLKQIRGLRHTHQHSGTGEQRPRILEELGVSHLTADWSALWDGLRARAIEALLTIRSEIRRYMESSL
jgi:hypothetical protein